MMIPSKKTLTTTGRAKASPGILLIFFICQLAVVGMVFAQPSGRRALSAEEFFKIFSQYDKFVSLKTAFTQKKIMPELNITLETSGTLTVKRPDEVLWEISQPEAMKIRLDPKTLTIISGTGAEQEVEKWSLDKAPKKVAEKMMMMKLWLNFDPKGLYERYKIYEMKSDQLKFVPKDNLDLGISTLEMHLHQSGYINRLILQEESGDILDYTFQRPQFNRVKSQ